MEDIASKDPIIHAQEIASTQTSWFFWGICAHGTKFPDGTVCSDNGVAVTAGGLTVDQIRYAKTAIDYSLDVPLLHYATNIERWAFSDERNNSETIVVSHITLGVSGIDELIISGRSEHLDNRSDSAPYVLIQRISSAYAKDLFQTLRVNSAFFDIYYKTAFPGLDSDKEGYTGLWRLYAKKLVLIEQEQLEEFAKANPVKQGHRKAYINEQDALELLDKSLVLPLNPPSGVGEIEDFTPIKNKIRAEWKPRKI